MTMVIIVSRNDAVNTNHRKWGFIDSTEFWRRTDKLELNKPTFYYLCVFFFVFQMSLVFSSLHDEWRDSVIRASYMNLGVAAKSIW